MQATAGPGGTKSCLLGHGGAEHLDEDPKLFLQLLSADQLHGDPGTQAEEDARNQIGDQGKTVSLPTREIQGVQSRWKPIILRTHYYLRCVKS